MKDRRLFWILLPVVVLVWGIVVHQFTAAIDEADARAIVAQKSLVSTENRVDRTPKKVFVYPADIKDPFQYEAPIAPHPVRAVIKSEPAWEPPPFRLTGIVGGRSKRTAVLEDHSGGTFFLQRGESAEGVTITAIADSTVQYRYKKRHAVWLLPPEGR